MIVHAVHRSAGKRPPAVDDQAVRKLLNLPAQRAQKLRHGAQTVALLHPQPRRAGNMRPSRMRRRRDGQRGHQIGCVGHVDFAAQFAQHPLDRAVALCRARAQSLAFHAAAKRVRRQPERRRRPVSLHAHAAGASIALPAGHMPPTWRFQHADAKRRQRFERDAHIRRRFQRLREHDFTVLRAQRQRQQKPGDVLRAHIPGHGIRAAGQPPRKSNRQKLPVRAYAVRVERVGQNAVRPFRKPPAAGKHAIRAQRRRHGQHEPQRRTAFPAVQHAQSILARRLRAN